MNNIVINPITILLIEDNPCQEGIKARDLKKRGKDIGDVDPNTNAPGIFFNLEVNKELHRLFDLKVLQHPEEIKEFISLIIDIEDSHGSIRLGEIPGAIPEVVVFDYKLSDNFDINTLGPNLKYFLKFKKLRELYNPNFSLINETISLKLKELYLEKEENINYGIKDFIDRINKTSSKGNEPWFKSDEDQLKNDELGLFAGVEITRLFRNHTCIGIPATFKKVNIGNLHAFSKFYEWVNEYDLGTMFSREERGEKGWDSVIPAAMKQLRIRTESLIISGKVTPNLTQLLKYSNNDLPTKTEERVFTVLSSYGIRHYPLDGLFIDKDEKERNGSIKEWTSILLNSFKSKEYKLAREAAMTLIKAYKSTTVIKNRIRLSELVVNLCNNEILNLKEIDEINALKTEFGINNKQVESCINCEAAEKCNITNKVVEYRDVKTLNNMTNRLIVLFTDLYVHKVWQGFCEINKNSTIDAGIISELKKRPTLEDLRVALFPIPKNPLVLPYHQHLLKDNKYRKKDPFEIWDSHLDSRKLNNHALYPKTEYPKKLNDSEIQLCKSFALEIELQQKYFPYWLLK
jgi:hypothetical protein